MRRSLRPFVAAGLASVGLIGAHAVAYAIAVGDAVHRTTLLEATGHAYLPGATAAAAVLGVLAAVGAVRVGRRNGPAAVAPLAVRLAAVQCVAFVGLEAAERVVAGAPLADLAGPLLLIGLAVQAIAAVAAAAVAVLLERVGRGLRGAEPRLTVPRPASVRPAASPRPAAVTLRIATVRGPPRIAGVCAS